MSNPLANQVFKFKFNGQKIQARVMDDGERINSRTLQAYPSPDSQRKEKFELAVERRNKFLMAEGFIQSIQDQLLMFHPCTCVGEKTDEHGHHNRIYIEVLSPAFSPISNDRHTNDIDKGMADI